MSDSHRQEHGIGATKRWLVWVGLGLGLAGGLGTLQGAPAEPNSIRAYVEQNQRRQAYGVYLKNHKFGWAIDEMKFAEQAGRTVAAVTFEMQTTYAVAQETSRAETRSVTYFDLEGLGEILSAEERVLEDGQETLRTVVRDGPEMVIQVRSTGGETTRRVPRPRETLALALDLERWLAGPPRKGATFESYSTAWEHDEINSRELLTYRGKKKMLWGGVRTEVFLVSVSLDGMRADFDLAADGTPLRGLMGGLFELRAEKESLAKTLSAQSIDMLQASSIKVDRELGAPGEIESLVLDVSGLAGFRVPTSHRQRLGKASGQAVRLELTRDRRTEMPTPLSPTERDQFLKPTTSLQAEHPVIQRQAREIIGTELDLLQRADLLQRWVYRNVRQTMAANQTSARDVLASRAGDCTEITMLFVALARAAAIPAREVGGVMYADEGSRIFGWHAWAEIHDGHQWVSVDPTWNEFYVDATHIKFSDDPADLSWVNLLGKIKIKVVKVAKKTRRPESSTGAVIDPASRWVGRDSVEP